MVFRFRLAAFGFLSLVLHLASAFLPAAPVSKSLAPSTSRLFLPIPPQIDLTHASSTTRPSRRTPTARQSTVNAAVEKIASSLLRSQGQVPFLQSFGLNAFLFTVCSPKLFTMMTTAGFFHAMALGTMLWTTLGWKAWTTCVFYLFLGQLVTKVKFAEKESKGIAEARGGRRGPENVW